MTQLSPGRLASVVALPLAAVTGIVVFQSMRPETAPKPSPIVVQPSGPVAVTPAPLSASSQAACGPLVEHLPEKIRSAVRRPVTDGARQLAAYGEPPFVLDCGVPKVTVEMSDIVMGLSGVCWHSAPGTGGATVWTTVDRTVAVRVTMPSSYELQAQWVVGFSPAVAENIPRTSEPLPSGCP